MSFSPTQVRQLARSSARTGIGAFERVIEHANRVFGYEAWDRETVSTECVWRSKFEHGFHAAYTAKVRITVRAGEAVIFREGHGAGEAKASTAGVAHQLAVTKAEEDAMVRTLATFGKRFVVKMAKQAPNTAEIHQE